MITVCKKDMCNGCMACVEKCRKNAILIDKQAKAYNAFIDENKCINCKICFQVCPRNDKKLPFLYPIKWYQGWTRNDKLREKATSGGAASEIMAAFIKDGGYVCSCLFKKGEFIFEVSDSLELVNHFVGSKYVKSNPEGSYTKIRHLLSKGNKVLFLGLPCQVAAMKKFVGSKYQERLYTIDLICHGTPSPILLKKYLVEHGFDIRQLSDISFRVKNDFHIQKGLQPIITPGIVDSYLYSFLKKINYTENCYSCQFACLERISDLTLGDSWGTNLSREEQSKGISLLLIQNDKGIELVKKASLELKCVDLENAIKNNAQLSESAKIPVEREKFYALYREGKDYDKIMFKIAPKVFIKQDIKQILVKLHLLSLRKQSAYCICVQKLEEWNA